MTKHWLPGITGLLVLLCTLLVAEPTFAQRGNNEPRPSPNAGLSQTIGTTVVDMHYSRPAVKGRTIFGGLEAWGKTWRAGANEPTTITFSGDVKIEGRDLPAGTYALWITPMETGDWDVTLGTMVRWGTMSGESDPVLTVSVAPRQGDLQEWLIYRFEDLSTTSATLVMHWENTLLPIRISV